MSSRPSGPCRSCSRGALRSWSRGSPAPTEWRPSCSPSAGGTTLVWAPILDANVVGDLEALLRYRGAAVAEFWRGLRTLRAFQAEQALPMDASAARPTIAPRVPPIEPSASWIVLPNRPWPAMPC